MQCERTHSKSTSTSYSISHQEIDAKFKGGSS